MWTITLILIIATFIFIIINKSKGNKNKIDIKEEEKEKKEEKEENKVLKELETFNEIIDLDFKKVKEIRNSLVNLKSFPSGNIVAVKHNDIIIYDINMNVIQTIENAHEDLIPYVDVKDENNFVTCSDDLSIKTWIKKDGKYQLNQTIVKAHSNFMNKVQYFSDDKIISCGYDGGVKLWEENDNKNFQSSLIFKTKYYGINVEEWEDETMEDVNKINSFYIVKDKGRLIVFNSGAIFILNLNNFEYINGYYGIHYLSIGYMKRISENLFAIDYSWGWADTGRIVILSLCEDKIIKEMETPFHCFGMLSLIDKNLLIIGGKKDIMFIKTNNFECLKIIKNVHDDTILKIRLLKNEMIATISHDKTLKIWSLENLVSKSDENSKDNNNNKNSLFLKENHLIMNLERNESLL